MKRIPFLKKWDPHGFGKRIPNFTRSEYKTNVPLDIEMIRGVGNTRIKQIIGFNNDHFQQINLIGKPKNI